MVITASIYKDKDGVTSEKRWEFIGFMAGEGKAWLVNVMSGWVVILAFKSLVLGG